MNTPQTIHAGDAISLRVLIRREPKGRVWQWQFIVRNGETFGGYCRTKRDAQNDLAITLKEKTGLEVGSHAFQRAIGLI